ncbi:hydrolase [Novosphingobium sp. MW5]|nr:hydrolase [Novosphingobium sp. MW5]
MQHLSPAESRMLAAINGAAMLARVERWCAINTGTGNLTGLSRLADELAPALALLPGQVRRVNGAAFSQVDEAGREIDRQFGQHLFLSVRPGANRRVLLTGHMDTVFPASDPFQTLRWLDAGTLNGPGVADMKGGIAVMLAALEAFETHPSASEIGYDVLLNSDEEVGSPSSAPLIAELAAGKLAALTFEPAALPDGTLAGERAGSGNYSLVIRGRSAHAGRNPEDGRNAIVAAAALTIGLKSLEREGLRVNPARIDGGSANNVVPDLAILRFNIRPQSTAEAEAFEIALSHLIEAVSREHGVSVHRHGGISRPPKPIDPPAQRLFDLVRQCGADLGQDIRWQRSGGVCDGNNIAACGVPVVDTLGVRGGAIHSPDEYLIVASLAERAALSALILSRIADGAMQ